MSFTIQGLKSQLLSDHNHRPPRQKVSISHCKLRTEMNINGTPAMPCRQSMLRFLLLYSLACLPQSLTRRLQNFHPIPTLYRVACTSHVPRQSLKSPPEPACTRTQECVDAHPSKATHQLFVILSYHHIPFQLTPQEPRNHGRVQPAT